MCCRGRSVVTTGSAHEAIKQIVAFGQREGVRVREIEVNSEWFDALGKVPFARSLDETTLEVTTYYGPVTIKLVPFKGTII